MPGFRHGIAGQREPLESRGNLANAGEECGLEAGQGIAAVDRAQRFEVSGGIDGRQDAPGPGIKQLFKKTSGNHWHIASYDQVSIACSVPQSGHDARQGALAGPKVGNHGVAQRGIAGRVAHQNGRPGSLADGRGHGGSHEESLIAAHAAAAAAGQYVSCLGHVEMIPSAFGLAGRPRRRKFYTGVLNILNYFCFRIVPIAGLAAGLWAAGPGDPPRHITSVVRSDPHTGKLVRTVVVTPKIVGERKVGETVVPARTVTAVPPAAADSSTQNGLDRLVDSVAAEHSLPPQLIHSVIKVESNYNPNAVSPKGALGLMQLIPATAQRFGVGDVFDPEQNIQGGARYLRYLLDLYNGNYALALAAYNAGEAAVARYGGVPPYEETRNYVEQVHRELEKTVAAQARDASKQKIPETQPAVPAGPAHIREVIDADGTVRYVSR